MKLRDLLGHDAAIEPAIAALEATGLALDSRVVKAGDLFFALAGSKTDGARFIDAAVAAGAVAVVGDHAPTGSKVPFITVANPRRALALAAARFFPSQPATIVCGWRPKKRAAASASARRGSSLVSTGTSSAASFAPLPTTIAAAPFFAASAAYAAPSALAPGTAKNRKPGATVRESDEIPPTAMLPVCPWSTGRMPAKSLSFIAVQS